MAMRPAYFKSGPRSQNRQRWRLNFGDLAFARFFKWIQMFNADFLG